MSSDRWAVDGMARDSHEMGLCRKTIALVDQSLKAHTNNRSAKLGFGNNTFATAILGYNATTKQIQAGDGTSSALARAAFEPDNWLERKHSGTDHVWSVRLSVDRDNKAQEKKNRSTHVIDQQHEQRYGNFADLFWICKTEAETDFDVNGAGYYKGGGGKRDALALSTAKNEGFISDGIKFGQLAHVFTFADETAEDQESPGGGGGRGDVVTPEPNTTPAGLRPPVGSGAFVNPPGAETQLQNQRQPVTGHEGQGQGPRNPNSQLQQGPQQVEIFRGADGSYYRTLSDGTVEKVPGT